MLYKIAHRFPDDMILEEDGPFISLYQPTHKHFPENKQDLIVFKNLVREIERLLQKQADKVFVKSIMKPFYELEENREFWNNTSDGIAVLAKKGKCIIYNLHSPVIELAVVADSFHIKPLIQAFQAMESYHLLSLGHDDFTLYQGNGYGFSEIALEPEVPRTLEEVLGKQLTEAYLTQGSFGGTGGPAIYHGQGDKKEEADKDTEKYFRYVDRFVYENYSKPSKLPLILVSLKEYRSHFKEISHNPYLIAESINASHATLDKEQLICKAFEVIEQINTKKTHELVKSFKKAEAELLGSSDIPQVAKAAYESRIETILIEADKIIPGKIDIAGEIILGDIDDPDCDDILDDLTALVLRKRSRVVILPKDVMPSLTGIAAIYRYK